MKSGGLALDTIDLANVPRDAAVWERVVRKLNTRTMPPLGAPRPDEASYHALASWLETRSTARRPPRRIRAARCFTG